MISTRTPARAAATASAAVTVVFPTPPLPATITTREVAQKRSRSMVQDATGASRTRRRRHAVRARSRRVGVGHRARASRPATLLLVAPSGAVEPGGSRRGIDVVQVEGYFDPPNESLVRDCDQGRQRTRRRRMLVLQVKSDGRDRRRRRRHRARHRPVRRARRGLGRAVRRRREGCSDHGAPRGRAPRVHLERRPDAGAGQPLRLDDPDASTRAGVADRLAALAETRGRNPDGARRARDGAVDRRDRRVQVGATDGVRPTIGELIVRLDGKTVHHRRRRGGAVDRQGRSATARTAGASRTRRCGSSASASTARSCTGSSARRSRTSCSWRGLALLVFEFYTAGDRAGGSGRGALRRRRVRRVLAPPRPLVGVRAARCSRRSASRSTSRWDRSACGRSSAPITLAVGFAVPLRRFLGAGTGVVGAAGGVPRDDPVHARAA